jgi:hypothetical protein
MATSQETKWNAVLVDAQRRLPAGRCFAQEAFTSDRYRPVLVKLNELRADTFYWFDAMTVSALFDAVVEYAARYAKRLTVSHIAPRRLQHIAAKLDQVCVLVGNRPGKELLQGARLQCRNTTGTPLSRYRIVLVEGTAPLLFIVREQRSRCLGFLTADVDVIEEVADDIEALLRGMGRRLDAFERLGKLHQTTQRVARELESYSRRLQLTVERAHRRPELLTPARFGRIVAQAIRKMEQLKEIPRRALRTMGKPRC